MRDSKMTAKDMLQFKSEQESTEWIAEFIQKEIIKYGLSEIIDTLKILFEDFFTDREFDMDANFRADNFYHHRVLTEYFSNIAKWNTAPDRSPEVLAKMTSTFCCINDPEDDYLGDDVERLKMMFRSHYTQSNYDECVGLPSKERKKIMSCYEQLIDVIIPGLRDWNQGRIDQKKGWVK